MKRIETLREEALHRPFSLTEFLKHFYEHYPLDSFDPRCYGDSFFHALSSMTPCISSGELIVGKLAPVSDAAEKEWREVYLPRAEKVTADCVGQDSHMAIDYELLLREGIFGILEKIERFLHEQPDNLFYQNCKKSLLGVLSYAEHYALHADDLAKTCQDPTRRAELLRIAEICRRVPAQPAESFYEAVQSVHFLTLCLSLNPLRLNAQQFQLGRPDQYLLPYYRADLQSGAITKEFAQLLLDCLGIQINHRVPNGLSSGYLVGGRSKSGEFVENELTQMLMQVVDDIRLVYPAVGLCHTHGMSDETLRNACRIILHGRSHPAIFNDDVITRGLESYGVPAADAHNYIHSTCVEITPIASSNVWVASPYTNMAQLLLDELENEPNSFDALLDGILRRLKERIKTNFYDQLAWRKRRAKGSINPLLSCFVDDCLEKGLDIEQGGARYNWIMPSFVGMANLVDSLYAVKVMVYEEKRLSLSELSEALHKNFADCEALRAELLHRLPKYGNDTEEVDALFRLISEVIVSECKQYTALFSHADLIPSVFCWIMHEHFGKETGATPDGRPAGFPLGDGSGPCQGREKNGPTASILSATKWDHAPFIGGVALNMKFSKASLGTDSEETLMSLVKTYLERGGFEMQINVVDQSTLRAARENPEAYSDLVVRIGGYSDYYVRLSDEMQEELLLRTEHSL